MSLLGNLVGIVRRAETSQPGPGGTVLTPPPRTLPKNFLIDQIDLQDRVPQKARVGLPGYAHVSSLIGACARQHVLAYMTSAEIVEPVRGPMRVVWALGRAAEHHVRTQVIAAANKQGVYGRWVCGCKHETQHVGFFPVNMTCQSCGSKLETYKEVTLLDHDYRITGNPDLVLRYGAFLPVECKSMNAKDFETIQAPLGDHVCQALMYRRMLALQGLPVRDEVVIFYVCKDFKMRPGVDAHGNKDRSPIYKEFHVDATTPASLMLVEAMLETAADIRDGMKTRVPPPRTVCQNQTCAQAKKCPVNTTCFNL